MIFNNKAPDWGNGGTEPPENLKKEGFTAGYKPPAAYFNWFFNRIQKAVKELQEKLATDLKGLAFKDTVSDADIDDVSAEKIEQDEAHRFVTDAEKNSWDKKASTLDADITLYVATAGSDTTGDGSETAPYKTITYAISKIPNDLGGHLAVINVADGTYDEDVVITGIANGYFRIQRNGTQELNSLCNVKSIYVENCDNISISGLNLTSTELPGIFGTRTDFINVNICQSISNANTQPSFNFDYVSVVRVAGNRSLNHYSCLRSYFSDVSSESWSSDSIGIQCGIDVSNGGKVTKIGVYQPRGNVIDVYYAAGIVVNRYGANIGTLSNNITLYVSPTGSDITGDGTSAKPFKTIQHAIDTLPKDLGSWECIIQIADGTYAEDIRILGFHSGVIRLYSSNISSISAVCSVNSFLVSQCSAYIFISGINIITTTKHGIEAFNVHEIIVRYCSATGSNKITGAGYRFAECTFQVSNCVASNKNVAMQAYKSHGTSSDWGSTSGNNIGIHSEVGSIVTNVGVQPQGTIPLQQATGGTFFNSNGTQISALITSGLSCTWGTIMGGYIRHGNYNSVGPAMITITVAVIINTTLNANNEYTIQGFPPFVGNYNFAVAVNHPSTYESAFFKPTGVVAVVPNKTLSTGTVEINVTYLTNS